MATLNELLNYAYNLRFNEKPDYNELVSKLRRLMKINNFENDWIMDWSQNLLKWKIKYRQIEVDF